jgi:hypothetical protein
VSKPFISSEALAAIIIALLSLAVAAWSDYSHNDKEIASRVTAVETQQKGDHEGIQRVESKVDRLVEWALGKQ